MVKLGVFGGRRGDCMLQWCRKTGGARVTAICERDERVVEKLRRDFPEGVTFCRDFEELLKCDVDAVILANFATEHAPYAIRCLEAGKHVLSEVLPCQNMAEAVALTEAVERSGKIYAYAENYCFMPAPREMRRLYREGKLGTFEYGEGEYVHNLEPLWPDITYGVRGHWRNRMYATFYCTHSIGPLIHITGLRPVTVTGYEIPFTERCYRMGLRAGLAGIEMITLENGAVLRSLHGNLAKDSIRYCVYGSKGRAESALADAKNGEMERIYTNLDDIEGVYFDNPSTYLPTDEISDLAKEAGHGGSDYYVMHNFIRALEGDKNAEIIDVYEAMDMFLPGLCAYFSILDGGKPVTVPNMRDKKDRDKYRFDTRCTDPEAAGEQLLPNYSKGEPEIPDEVYDTIRNQYENNLRRNGQ